MGSQASMTSLSTEQDCADFVRGCTLLATGGGGPPERGLAMLREAAPTGTPAGWVDPEGIPDGAYTVSVYGMGGRSPAGHPTAEELAAVGLSEPRAANTMAEAVHTLAAYAGVEIAAVVPIELGGSNTPGPMVVAVALGMVVPDGDYTGRAIPEITQIVPSLAGVAAGPFATVDRWGNVCILAHVTGDAMAERIGKLLSQAAFGGVSMAGFLMPAVEMRRVLVRGSLSRALALGRAIREARESGRSPIEAITRVTGGVIVFDGEVTATELDDSEGYRYGIGTHRISGIGRFGDTSCSIWYKNENHVCWIDGAPRVMSPDLICVVDAETGEPKVNAAVARGQRVVVIGVPATETFRSTTGIARLGPRHFGFDIDYVPLESGLPA